MIIQISECPGSNSYILSLIEAYKKLGLTTFCGKHNFFCSNIVPDLLHIHWPEMLIEWFPFAEKEPEEKLKEIKSRLDFFKQNNTKIILTIHNIRPHDKSKDSFELNLYKTIIKKTDIFVHHCPRSIDLLKSNYYIPKDKKHVVANHGDYLHDYENLSKYSAREKLNIDSDKFVILNFGQQRLYKGEDFIQETFDQLKINEKFLLTAGNYQYPSNSYSKTTFLKLKNKIRERQKFSSKKFIIRPIKQKELPVIFNSADLIFVAHKSGLTSGILNMAATFSKPIVFPDIGCFEYQMKDWVYKKFNPESIGEAIKSITSIYKEMHSGSFKLDNTKWIMNNSWENHVNKILEVI